jgi:1,4-dihydroxy-6-naphthoate synthase
MKMKSTQVFTLGHSPDPDDALMFYAMAENKIDLRRYRFDHRLPGIQTLNERARRGELHISAISIHARGALPAFAAASAE